MRKLLKFRKLKERDCATVAERCRALPPLPSLPLSLLRVLLSYAVTVGSRNSREGPRDLSDVTRSNTQRCVLRRSDFSVYRRDWRQCSSSRVPVVFMRVHVSSQWVIGVSWEDCFCEEKIYVEYLECRLIQFVRRHPLLGDDQWKQKILVRV
jgi:hypothetical protein